jgi:hypothetical protein
VAGSRTRKGAPWHGVAITMLVLAGCSSAATTPLGRSAQAAPSIAASPSATTPASLRPTESPSPQPTSTTYTSSLYGYSLALPAGWQVVPASTRWDGISDPGHDEPPVDQMSGPETAVAWAFSTPPITKDLRTYASDRLAADAKAHPCPKTAATTDKITIDGLPGLLMSRDCGILVLTALTIRRGTGFVFYLQDSSIHSASYPPDKMILAAMLASVGLP